MLKRYLTLASMMLAFSAVAAEKVAPAPAVKADTPAAVVESESQQYARTLLMEMAKFLGDSKKFSVTLRAGYDVLQASGQMIEFGEMREVSVQRPNQLRLEEKTSHGGQDLMLMDGKNITMFNGETGKYAQTPQSGNTDASIVYFVRDLKMRLPLAPIFMSHFPEELQRRVTSIDYVGEEEISGKPVHHVAARTANVDFQVWIADDKRPLPLRIVITYKALEGQPQFWADFSKWNMSPRFAKSTFKFKPPKDSKQIAFAAQVGAQAMPQSSQTQPANKQPQGGKP